MRPRGGGRRPYLPVLALAFALLASVVLRVASEKVTLTTSYPSPAGIYQRLVTTGQTVLARDEGGVTLPWSEFFSYSSGNPAVFKAPAWPEGNNVPKEGRLFYNREKDQFYYTSRQAMAGQPSTWYKPMSGLQETLIINGAASYTPPDAQLRYVPWSSASPGSIVCTAGTCLRSTIQNTAGLYVIELTGNYCAPLPRSGGTTGEPITTTNTTSPRFLVYWRRCSTSSCTGFAVASDLNGDFEVDPVTGCGEFGVQSMIMSVANQRIDLRFRFQRDAPNNAIGGVADRDSVTNVRMTATRVLGF